MLPVDQSRMAYSQPGRERVVVIGDGGTEHSLSCNVIRPSDMTRVDNYTRERRFCATVLNRHHAFPCFLRMFTMSEISQQTYQQTTPGSVGKTSII